MSQRDETWGKLQILEAAVTPSDLVYDLFRELFNDLRDFSDRAVVMRNLLVLLAKEMEDALAAGAMNQEAFNRMMPLVLQLMEHPKKIDDTITAPPQP